MLYEGKFFNVTWDLAIMFPMLEMASDGHIRFIPDVLYIYNADNPLSDIKQQRELQKRLEDVIRKKTRYECHEQHYQYTQKLLHYSSLP